MNGTKYAESVLHGFRCYAKLALGPQLPLVNAIHLVNIFLPEMSTLHLYFCFSSATSTPSLVSRRSPSLAPSLSLVQKRVRPDMGYQMNSQSSGSQPRCTLIKQAFAREGGLPNGSDDNEIGDCGHLGN